MIPNTLSLPQSVQRENAIPFNSEILDTEEHASIKTDNYISFMRASPDESAKYKQDLISYLKNSDNQWYKAVGVVIDRELKRNGLRCSVDIDNTHRVAAIHLVSHNDFKLIKLANELKDHPMSFPRGFAFLLDAQRQQVIGLSAFYPKFSNDNKQNNFLQSQFADETSLDVHIKYSGCLGKIAFFEHPDRGLSYSVFSKNSASTFNADGTQNTKSMCPKIQDAVKDSLTKETLQKLWDQGIRGFCCEVISMDDQVHGYGYKETGYVVTALSKDDNTFCTPEELYDICHANNLPADPPIHLDHKQIQPFISDLIEIRDLLTYPQLQTLYKKHHLPEGFLHKQLIDSDIIEGFVIRCSNGSRVKFKCWPYLLSTMVLRDYLVGNNFDNRMSQKPLTNPDGTMHADLANLLDSQLNHWVTSTKPEVRDLARWLVKVSVAAENNPQATQADRPVWISLTDFAITRFGELMKKHNFDLQQVHKAVKNELSTSASKKLTERTVIVVLGPVGYGKTTFARQLAEQAPCLKHIDGDDLDLGARVTSTLRQKRNIVTCATVQSVLMNNRTPILSTGGGAVWFNLRSKINDSPYLEAFLKSAGIQPDFKLLVPGEHYRQGYSDKAIEQAYLDDASVRSTISWRKQNKVEGWEKPNTQKVVSNSRKNHAICNQFLSSAAKENIYSYPRCRGGSFTDINFRQVVNDLISCSNDTPLTSVKAKALQQYYTASTLTKVPGNGGSSAHALLQKDKLLHRTIAFSPNSIDRQLPIAPEMPVGKSMEAKFTGIFNDDGSQLLCSFIHLPELGANAHLTVDSGSFAAKDMSIFAEALSRNERAVNITRKGEHTASTLSFSARQQSAEITARHVVALNEF